MRRNHPAIVAVALYLAGVAGMTLVTVVVKEVIALLLR